MSNEIIHKYLLIWYKDIDDLLLSAKKHLIELLDKPNWDYKKELNILLTRINKYNPNKLSNTKLKELIRINKI